MRLLKLAGINPGSVSIVGVTDEEYFAAAIGPVINIEKKEIKIETPAKIFFNLTKLKDADHKLFLRVIAHEIGHLVCHHTYSFYGYAKMLTLGTEGDATVEQLKDKALKKYNNTLSIVHELEADIALALRYKEVAAIMHEFLLQRLAEPLIDIRHATKLRSSPIHQSYNDLYHWIQTINAAHEKKEKNKAQKMQTAPLPQQSIKVEDL